jgi:signal transduction histidine kinase
MADARPAASAYVGGRTVDVAPWRMCRRPLSAMVHRARRSEVTTMTITRQQMGDVALAFTLVVVGVLGTHGAGATDPVPSRPLDPAAYALVAAAGAVLVTRRRWPLATLVVSALLIATYLVAGYPYGPIFFPFFVAAYTAARYRPIAQAGPVALVAVLVLLTHLATHSGALPGLWGVLPAAAWVAVPFAIGVTVRVSRQASERERAGLIRQRVDEERLRVAHDVHDIVGHGLAAIRMQADVALHVMSKKPEQAQIALDAISRTSGEALQELRATLGAIRDAGTDTDRTPQPGLGRLQALQQRMSDAGARIHVDTVGNPRPLPADVDVAGYRVVQESLTNVLRHSEAKVADVQIDYTPDAVVITVSNPAPDVPARGGGLGVAGMRQRVTGLGGEFSAGPTPDQRFEVRASLPTIGQR